jgi:hypothetical protein
MCVLGFSVFEKEFNSTGPKKADGYTFANFDNMTPAEKAKAAEPENCLHSSPQRMRLRILILRVVIVKSGKH